MVNMNGPVKMASYDMAGKTAVVTGGTKGIGKAIALAFGQCGANVVVAGRHEDECTAVAEAITSAGGHGKGIRTDVRNIDEIDAAIENNLKGWSKQRISKVSLALLRMAVCEMKYFDKVPVGVSINEAVEICKVYGSDEDKSFVNGILGSISREKED